jgi:saccharopine dehydrogenase-like NADP-dependent oxidoreductase
VTFKYGLGDEFIGILKTLHMLGLDNKEPIKVKGVEVAPRDVVAACLPDPAHLGPLMEGKTCAGTWVKGKKMVRKNRSIFTRWLTTKRAWIASDARLS